MIAQRRPARRKAGLTILEVLVVLAIIGMIAAIAAPRLIGYLGRAKSETAELQINQLRSALQLLYVDIGRFPTEAEGLAVLFDPISGEPRWNGPYLDRRDALIDPWSREYVYEEPQGSATPIVFSLGRDGRRGGTGEDADIGLGR